MNSFISTEQEYRDALNRLGSIMHAEHGTPDGREAEALITQIIAYEKPFTPNLPDPIEMIKYAMENRGWGISELEPILGIDQAQEVISRKLALTEAMIQWFHQYLGISLECLSQEYPLTRN